MHNKRDIFKIETNHIVPARGKVLISEPFLCDCIFERAVILLIDHSEEGSVGLVLNKPLPWLLNDVLSMSCGISDIPLYRGGPLGTDTLFYVHTIENIPHSIPISKGFYLNGDFQAIQNYVKDGNPVKGKVRFFLGYSGWSEGQLAQEIDRNTWIVGTEDVCFIMNENTIANLWEMSLKHLGNKYCLWSRFPKRPTYN